MDYTVLKNSSIHHEILNVIFLYILDQRQYNKWICPVHKPVKLLDYGR